MVHPNTRHKKWLANEDIELWHRNLGTKSMLTADNYLRNLGSWMESIFNLKPDDNSNKTIQQIPAQLIDLAKNDKQKLKKIVEKQIRKMEDDGIAGSTISVSIRPLINFLKRHDAPVDLNSINIKNQDRHLTTENERVPSRWELDKILTAASNSAFGTAKVAVVFMAYSGVRPEVLGDYTGKNGLMIGDIPDLTISENKVQFKKVPARVEVRHELSKARVKFFTFLADEGCVELKTYLEERLKRGEKLDQYSPILKPADTRSRLEKPNKFLQTTFVSRYVKDAITKAGFKWRPYVLRAYFATALDRAENKGWISHPWRQFMMGHKGDIEARYSTEKKLPEDMIEEMRESYKKCEVLLVRSPKPTDEISGEITNGMIRRSVMLTVGFTEEEIKNMDFERMSDEQYRQLTYSKWDEIARTKFFRNNRVQEAIVQQMRKLKEEIEQRNNGSRDKIIQSEFVEAAIEVGFELKQFFPNGEKAVITLPLKNSV